MCNQEVSLLSVGYKADIETGEVPVIARDGRVDDMGCGYMKRNGK